MASDFPTPEQEREILTELQNIEQLASMGMFCPAKVIDSCTKMRALLSAITELRAERERLIHRGMGSDLVALCGRMEGGNGNDQVHLSYVDEQVTCPNCLRQRLVELRAERDRLLTQCERTQRTYLMVGREAKGLQDENERLRKEVCEWQEYYGADNPRDGVIGSAAGKIVAKQNRELAALRAERDRLLSQLPDGMQGCTIRFHECDKGHGRLTATNWVQHECQKCEIDRLLEAAKPFVAYADAVSEGWQDDTGPSLLFRQPDGKMEHKPRITLGDCRRIAEAVKDAAGTTGEEPKR